MAQAQMEIGDNLNLKLSGDLGWGYNGSFTNTGLSGNSQTFVGSAQGSGYYFHPNFLTFNFTPYWDRSQFNSETQNINRTSGIGASVGLFNGSRFPGSISFGKNFNSTSEYQIAGIPTLNSNGSGQNLGITWSAQFPNAPRVTATYSLASSQAEVDGGNSTASHTRNLFLDSSYRLRGFDLTANLTRSASEFETPTLLTGESFAGTSSSLSYGASIGHTLPLRGSLGLGWSHSTTGTDEGSQFGGSNYSASMSILPLQRWTLFQSANYTTNLATQVIQTVFNGAPAEPLRSLYDSRGFFYNAGSNLYIGRGLSVGGYFNHRIQNFAGESYEDSQYGGNLHFTHQNRLFGFLTFGVGVVDTASEQGNTGAGFTGNVSMTRRFGKWETSADFNYNQDVLTLGSVKTMSNYSYGFSAHRRVSERLAFGGAFRGSQSGLVVQEGNGNNSQSVSGFLQFRRYNLNGSYSQGSGTAVLNSAGTLTPMPSGSLFTDDLLLFNARSLSFGGGALLFRRISVSGGYSRFNSGTGSAFSSVVSEGNRYSTRVDYRLRRFRIVGGYSRSVQDVSTRIDGPRMVNSYFVSISRWFNVF